MAAKPILYHVNHAPSSRALYVMKILGIEDKIEVRTLAYSDMKNAEFLALNPSGTIPCLIQPDGEVILESAAIALYLAEKYAPSGHHLLGKPEDRAKFLMIMFFGPATIAPLLHDAHHECFKPKDQRNQAVLDATKAKLQKPLKFLDNALGDRQFMLGDEYSLADLMLCYDLWVVFQLKWAEDFPKLKEYHHKVMNIDAVASTHPQNDTHMEF